MNELSRRRFLKIAGLSSAGVLLTGAGLGYAVTRPPRIHTPAYTFSQEAVMQTSQSERVLVTYATRAGSTGEVAAAIGAGLSAKGYLVDVIPVKSQPDPADYTAVIVGSAIRMGRWLPEAVDFVRERQSALNARSVALFTVHMLNSGEDETSAAARRAYLDPVRPLLKGAEEIYFTGLMDFSRLSFLDRLIAKMVMSEETDQRDWEEIRGWTPRVLV